MASDLHAGWHLNTFRMYRSICKMLDIGVPMDSEMLSKHLKKMSLKLCTAELIFLDNMTSVATETFIWFRCDAAWIRIVTGHTSAHPNISGARPTNGILSHFRSGIMISEISLHIEEVITLCWTNDKKVHCIIQVHCETLSHSFPHEKYPYSLQTKKYKRTLR